MTMLIIRRVNTETIALAIEQSDMLVKQKLKADDVDIELGDDNFKLYLIATCDGFSARVIYIPTESAYVQIRVLLRYLANIIENQIYFEEPLTGIFEDRSKSNY